MRKIFILPVTIFGVILIACSGFSINHALEDADRLVFTNPDSALSVLASIDTTRCNRSQKARCRLLEAKAYSKARILYPEYEYLNSVIKYYSEGNDSLEMQSKFYYGSSLRQFDRPAEALPYLLEAFDLAKKNHDNFYAGLISRIIFFAYQDLCMADSSAVWAPREKEYFLKTNLPNYIHWADATLVEGLINEGKYEACLDSIDKVNKTYMQENAAFRHQILKFKAAALCNTGKTQEAIDCYINLLNDSASLNSREWSSLAEMMIISGRDEEAKECLSNSMELAESLMDSVGVWRAQSLL